MLTREEILNISKQNPVVLFDGVCNLCNNTVKWLIRSDKKEIFRFASLQYARQIKLIDTAEDSVVLLYNGQIFQKSNAAIEILKILGRGNRIFAKVFRLFPATIRDYVYDIVAKYRYRWFGKRDVCMLPDTHQKARFLG